MIARAWFAFSVIWALLMLLALCFGGGNADGQIWLLVLAAAPLVIGLMFLKVARYITTGRLS